MQKSVNIKICRLTDQRPPAIIDTTFEYGKSSGQGEIPGSVQDLVKFQNRQYSLDGRRCVDVRIALAEFFVILVFILIS